MESPSVRSWDTGKIFNRATTVIAAIHRSIERLPCLCRLRGFVDGHSELQRVCGKYKVGGARS